MNPPAVEEPVVLLSPRRVILFAIVTQGLYFFYWFYLTWKQLERETGEKHYPVWHALTQFVPIYQLFRAHRHLSVIARMATALGREPLAPGLGIALILISNLCAGASFRIDDQALLLLLSVLSTALMTVVMASYQEELNAVWVSKLGSVPSRSTPTATEAVFLGVGMFFWGVMFVGFAA